MIKYILLDVSGTILYKPNLFIELEKVLKKKGCFVSLEKLKYNHKLLSETIKFPDQTDREFYNYFNSELLFSLGILPEEDILEDIFNSCTYLPWEKYKDSDVLKEIDLPKGILSNFNSTLEEKLNAFFGPIFSDVFVSEKIGHSKPSLEFYELAAKKIGIKKNEILYIGDSFKLDLMPAKKIGFDSYVIDREGVYEKGENVISSLYEIKELLK